MQVLVTFFDAKSGQPSPYRRGTGAGQPLDALMEKLTQLGHQVTDSVAAAQDTEATKYLATMKERTNQPFQTVPSYIGQAQYGGKNQQGVHSYPKGSLSTFARSSGAASRASNLDVFAGSRNIIVQRWKDRSTTAVSELLTKSPTYDATNPRGVDFGEQTIARGGGKPARDAKLTTHIGYEEGVGKPRSATAHIGWVYFGTKKMVARPFIEQVVLSNRTEFVSAIASAADAALDRATTNAPSGALGKSSAATLGQQYAVGRGVRPKPSRKPLRADELPSGKQTTPRYPPYYRKGPLVQDGRTIPPVGGENIKLVGKGRKPRSKRNIAPYQAEYSPRKDRKEED